MKYKSVWWDTSEDEYETIDTIMESDRNKGWEIFKMFLVYKGVNEAYRLILSKNEEESDKKNNNKNNKLLVKKDLNNKSFDDELITIESNVFEFLSVGTLNCLKNLDLGNNSKIKDCIGIKRIDLMRVRNFGKKRINEFEKLLNSAGVSIL